MRQMAKSKRENWGEVERAQLQLGKARAAWEKDEEGGSPPAGLCKYPPWCRVRRARSAVVRNKLPHPCQSIVGHPPRPRGQPEEVGTKVVRVAAAATQQQTEGGTVESWCTILPCI